MAKDLTKVFLLYFRVLNAIQCPFTVVPGKMEQDYLGKRAFTDTAIINIFEISVRLRRLFRGRRRCRFIFTGFYF